MKKVILVLVVVVVGLAVLLGAFYSLNNYIYNEKQEPNSIPELPLPQQNSDAGLTVEVVEYPELGFKFAYLKGDDGYTLIEPEASVEGGPVKTLMLVHADDMPAVENPPEGGEGPATITIQVFENTKKQFPRQWAEENNAYSNIGLVMGEIEEAVVGGANAITYKADGLYASNVAVFASGEKMYVVQGAYRDEANPTFRDFTPLLNTIAFIPEPGQQ
ncbi:MAG TPA: hypothetical protein VGE31_00270 [Candidatus Paceibacterota bacterium]